MHHPGSRVWLDVVSQTVVDGTTGHHEVEAFLANMARLGEPFVFGLDKPSAFFAPLGFDSERVAPASAYHAEDAHRIFDLYSFHVLRPRADAAA